MAPPAAAAGGLQHHMVSTDLTVPGFEATRSLGTARGISVQSNNLVRNIGAGLKKLVGGEINNFTHLCERAREEAFNRMLQHAASLGATAIAGMRYESNDVSPGVIEVVAYGTAVCDNSAVLPVASVPADATESLDAPLFGGGRGSGAARGASSSAAGAASSGGGNDEEVLHPALASTTGEVLGHRLPNSLGLVQGITVRSRNAFSSIGADLKASFLGGEIQTWTTLCEQARGEALTRMLREAAEKGAGGVVALRYETNEIAPGVTEVLAYGTAVVA